MKQTDTAITRARYKILALYHRPVKNVLIDIYNRRGGLRGTAEELGISLTTTHKLFKEESISTGRKVLIKTKNEPDPAA